MLVGLSGLYIEIINAFEYMQGARKGFKNLMQKYCLIKYVKYVSYCIDSEFKPEKTDADCIGSENKCSTYDFISYKNALDLFELSIMVR